MQRKTGLVVLLGLIAVGIVAWFVMRGSDQDSQHAFSVDETSKTENDAKSEQFPATLRGTKYASSEDALASDKEATDRSPKEEIPVTNDGYRVVGVIVNKRGEPQSGARVEARTVIGELAGTPTLTDASGRFDMLLDAHYPTEETRSLMLMLRVQKGDLVAAHPAYVLYQQVPSDARRIELYSGFSFDVRVTSNACSGVPPATVVVQRFVREGMSTGAIARHETDVAGHVRVGPVPAGKYKIYAYADSCGRGEAGVTLPQGVDAPVEIEIEESRDIMVTVVDGDGGEPVPHATLELLEHIGRPRMELFKPCMPPLNVPPTDQQGVTIIQGVSKSVQLAVMVKVDGRMTPTQSSAGIPLPLIKADETEARIELPPTRTVRWPITDKEGPIPDDGTKLALKSGPQSRWVSLPKAGRVEQGHVVIDGLLPTHIHALAVTPDGRIARLFAKNTDDLGNATSFRSPRSIDVTVMYPDGTPVTGRWVHLRGPGNNSVGEALPLDDKGKATFRNLYGMRVTVYLSEAGETFGGIAIGNVDLDKGSGRVDHTLARKREVLLMVTLNGKPGIPAKLTPRTWSGMASTAHPIEVVDAAKGIVRIWWQPPAPGAKGTFGITTPGWIAKKGELPIRLEDSGSGAIERALHLVRGGTLEIRIQKPPKRMVGIVLQHWAPERSVWNDTIRPIELSPDGSATLDALYPGRYRLASRMGGGVSAPVQVDDGQTTSVTFDLSREGIVSGRVEFPEGTEFNGGSVEVVGRSYVARGRRGWPVRPDGTFQLVVSGTEDVVLRPKSGLLIPASSGGSVKVKEPRDGIVLRLAAGPVITAKLNPAPPIVAKRHDRKRLLAFKGAPTSIALGREVTIKVEDGVLSAGGLPPGTWTLWLDIPGFVPLTIKDVEVTESGADLGALTLSRGSSFRLNYKVKDGQSPPRITVWVQSATEPKYSRNSRATGTEMLVTGIGSGRHLVRGMSLGGGGGINEEIEFDGESLIERTIDLR